MSTNARRGGHGVVLGAGHPRPSASAARDLAVLTVAVWMVALVVPHFRISEALESWNRAHEEWAIHDFTLVSLCAVAGLGVFAWRRWQESLRTIARHEATLQRLRSTEHEVEAKDQLIRTVSHELRTPLSAILGYAELLGEEGETASGRQEMVATILRQGRDLAAIVEDLLTRAQSEAKTLRVVAVPVNLTANVRQVLEVWDAGESGEVAFFPSPVTASGDPTRVRQILRNLIANAFRHGRSPVEISIGTGGDMAVVTVADAGPGIPAEDAERMFQPYQRVGDAPTTPGSIGLGLAISRELARLMGGDLVYRRVGGRTRFELRLPLVREAPQGL